MDYLILSEFLKSHSVHWQYRKGGSSEVKFREVTVTSVNVKVQAAHRLVSRSTAAAVRCLADGGFFGAVKVNVLMGRTKETPCVIIRLEGLWRTTWHFSKDCRS